VSDNTANLGGGVAVGCVGDTPTVATLSDTIVAGNHLAGVNPRGTDLYNVAGDTFTGTYNIIGDGTGQGGGALVNGGAGNNRVGTAATPINPLLAPLGTYGATNGSQTLALLPGSPAIDTGACPTYTTKPLQVAKTTMTTPATVSADARGITRPQNGVCDVGAFESRGFALALGGGSGQSAVITTAFAAPLVARLTPGDPGVPVAGVSVTFAAPGSGASAAFAPTTGTTDASGNISTVATANGTAGAYSVTAAPTLTTAGVMGTATFALTNTLPTLTLTSPGPTVVEGQAFAFTLTLSPPVQVAVGVPFTLSGSAQPGTDYTAPPSPLTIAAGSATGTLIVATVDNAIDQPSRTLTVALGTPFNATLGTGTTSTGTITDNDPATAVADGPYSVTAGTTLTVPAATGVLTNDTSVGTVTLTVTTPPTRGSVTLNTNGGFVYVAAVGAGGADSFRYTISENDGTTSAPATVSITVNAAIVTSLTTTAPPAGMGGNAGTSTNPVLRLGGTLTLTTTGTFNNGTTGPTSGLIYTSSNPNVARVDPVTGAITALTGGTTTITVTAPNGTSTQITVTVLPATGTGLMPAPQPMAHASGAAIPNATVAPQPAAHPAGAGAGTGGGGLQPQAAGSPTATPDAQPGRHP